MFFPRIAVALVSLASLAGCSSSPRPEARTGSVADLCAGVEPSAAQATFKAERIYAIEPLYVKRPAGKLTYERLGGATVRLKNDGSTSADALQRSLDCHAARGTLIALSEGQAKVTVEGFAREMVVRIEGDTREAGREIYEKAKVLAPEAVVEID